MHLKFLYYFVTHTFIYTENKLVLYNFNSLSSIYIFPHSCILLFQAILLRHKSYRIFVAIIFHSSPYKRTTTPEEKYNLFNRKLWDTTTKLIESACGCMYNGINVVLLRRPTLFYSSINPTVIDSAHDFILYYFLDLCVLFILKIAYLLKQLNVIIFVWNYRVQRR